MSLLISSLNEKKTKIQIILLARNFVNKLDETLIKLNLILIEQRIKN